MSHAPAAVSSPLATPRGAFRAGLAEAVGTPSLIIAAGFLGFGALCSQSGVSLAWALSSSLFIWALPGQLLLIESLPLGLSLLTIILGVGMANIRLMPMVAVLTPYLREGGVPRWQQLLGCHMIALTTWIHTVHALGRLAPAVRAHFLYGMGVWLVTVSLLSTLAGYLAGGLPPVIVLALVMSMPVYFLIVLVVDLSDPRRVVAIVAGLVLGPLLYRVSADWYLPLAGLIGGTVAVILYPPRRHRVWPKGNRHE